MAVGCAWPGVEWDRGCVGQAGWRLAEWARGSGREDRMWVGCEGGCGLGLKTWGLGFRVYGLGF